MRQAITVQITDLEEGLRIHDRGSICEPSGDGTIIATEVGERWGYHRVAIEMDDGRRRTVPLSLFNDGSSPAQIGIHKYQCLPGELRAMPTVEEVVGLLTLFQMLPKALEDRPLNFTPCRISEDYYHLEIGGVWWEVCDNGGEIKTKRMNRDELCWTIPLRDDWAGFNVSTVACWLATAFRGEPIDFQVEIPEEMDAVLREVLAEKQLQTAA